MTSPSVASRRIATSATRHIGSTMSVSASLRRIARRFYTFILRLGRESSHAGGEKRRRVTHTRAGMKELRDVERNRAKGAKIVGVSRMYGVHSGRRHPPLAQP